MSHADNEEFVVLPSQSRSSNVTSGIEYSGSHAPGYSDVSGRQHRPTGHSHEALRYSEVDDDLEHPGPGRERRLSMGCALAGSAVPPDARVDEPGNLVNSVTRAGLRFEPPEAAMLKVSPALGVGGVCGHLNGAQGLTNDPPLPTSHYS